MITAPVSGRILQITERSERVIREGDMLMQIGDPRDLEIIVDYLSADAVRIEAGQRVIIDNWGGDEPLVKSGGSGDEVQLGFRGDGLTVVIEAPGHPVLQPGYEDPCAPDPTDRAGE